jgi:hypothetical protein
MNKFGIDSQWRGKLFLRPRMSERQASILAQSYSNMLYICYWEPLYNVFISCKLDKQKSKGWIHPDIEQRL